jgi:squalene cyclase
MTDGIDKRIEALQARAEAPGGSGSSVPALSPKAPPIVDREIKAAQRALATRWDAEGYWRDYCDAGPAATAVVTVALKFIGKLDPQTARGVATYLKRIDVGEGAFPSYPNGDCGDLAATAACYAGLIAAGVPEDHQRVVDAKAYIQRNGGEDKLIELARAGDLAALTLAMVGKLKAKLPRTPLLFSVAPGSEYLLAQRFGYLIPFRALVSDVIASCLENGNTPAARPPTLPGVPHDAQELAGKLHDRLRAAADQVSRTADTVTRSGADLASGFVKGAARSFLGIAQGGLTAAAGVADSLRVGPAGLLDGALRGALQTGQAATTAALAAATNLSRIGPAALKKGRTALDRVEGFRCDLYLHRFRNEDGSWLYGDSVHTALALAAYRALGFQPTDQTISESVDWLKKDQILTDAGAGGLRFNVFYTDIWPTSFVLRALLESGTPVTDPAISRAVNWLIAVQRSGTWAFQATNTTTPDADDTAMAMAALAIARDKLAAVPAVPGVDPTGLDPESLHARCDSAIAAARKALQDRQNADGGWAAYQPGLPGKHRGAIMTDEPKAPALDKFTDQVKFTFNPDPELGDPATEDVTGRVLFAFGKSGVTAEDPMVGRAIQFLIDQQDTQGGWWGRWVVNYVASTAWVLRGLSAVNADLTASFVQNAIAFLRGRQRPDGGWTDSVKSYRAPDYELPKVPANPSNPSLTGLVLCALIELGEADSDMVRQGIEFLLDYHRGHGWTTNDADVLHTLYPPALFYTLPQTVLQLPLEALALYQREAPVHTSLRVVDGSGPPADPFRTVRLPLTRDQVSHLKRLGDPDADAVLDKIWDHTKQIPSREARIGAIFQSLVHIADFTDERKVEGPAARNKKAETPLALRSPKLKLDEGRIKNAQTLFQNAGFGVPLVLFCSSLPQCYAVPYGAKILMTSGRLATNPRGRMIETAQFVFDVLSPGGLEDVPANVVAEYVKAGRTPPGRGLRTARKVRLMHATIRRLLRESHATPDLLPISQFEMIGTLMTFSVVVTEGLRALGFAVTEEQADDWFYLWQNVGALLGVEEPEWLSLRTAADGADFFEHVREDWATSDEGTALEKIGLDLMSELLPAPELAGVGPTLVRHLAGERCADLLGVPPSDWTQILVDNSPTLATVEGRVLGQLYETPLTPLLQQAAFGTMQALSRQQRDSKNVAFSIPTDFLNAWRGAYQGKFRP